MNVFSTRPLAGNPLGAVLGADDLTDDRMAALAGWLNLSETTFLLSFAAPPLLRTGPLGAEVLTRVTRGLRLATDAVVASRWIDNGPG